MITVEVYTGQHGGGWNPEPENWGEAEDAESAITAARTLWDESYTGLQGCRRQIRFINDAGEIFRRIEARP